MGNNEYHEMFLFLFFILLSSHGSHYPPSSHDAPFFLLYSYSNRVLEERYLFVYYNMTPSSNKFKIETTIPPTAKNTKRTKENPNGISNQISTNENTITEHTRTVKSTKIFQSLSQSSIA